MPSLPTDVVIREVGLRDGLQSINVSHKGFLQGQGWASRSARIR